LPRRWKTCSLVWKRWEEEFIVFSISSGNTHLLNPVAAKVLTALEKNPGTAAEICQRIASEFQLESDDEVIQHVEKLLSDLHELGLIEPVSQ
jgi:PqqD family protein of HPr-rel-A system